MPLPISGREQPEQEDAQLTNGPMKLDALAITPELSNVRPSTFCPPHVPHAAETTIS